MGAGGAMMREKPSRCSRGKTGNGRESGHSKRKRCRNNIDTSIVDVGSDQLSNDDNQQAERGAQDVGL